MRRRQVPPGRPGRAGARSAPATARSLAGRVAPRPGAAALDRADASLLDLVDHVVTKGVVLDGEVVLGLADVDLIYLRLTAILCAADRLLAGTGNGRRRWPGRAG